MKDELTRKAVKLVCVDAFLMGLNPALSLWALTGAVASRTIDYHVPLLAVTTMMVFWNYRMIKEDLVIMSKVLELNEMKVRLAVYKESPEDNYSW